MSDSQLHDLITQLKELYEKDGEDLTPYLESLKYQQYTNYWDYINLDALLNLQQPKSNQPDEVIFIIYHQITELYFKLSLLELQHLSQNPKTDADHWQNHLSRIVNYFRVLTQSFSIMTEGMDPDQFLKFRNTLTPASGFQSVQYRMIELASTPLINLVKADQQEALKDATVEEQFEAIYWKQGAIDQTTGKKTLTLKHFEDKYQDFLLDYVRSWKGQTLWDVFQETPDSIRNNDEVIRQMRYIDKFVNIHWPQAHYGTAKRYLEHSIKGTGGTNYHDYLPPAIQKRMFFPDLWDQDEKLNWAEQHQNPDK